MDENTHESSASRMLSERDASVASLLAANLLESAASPEGTGGKQTAKRAVAILIGKNVGFYEPTARERDALLVGFAMSRKVIYGAAFDLVRLSLRFDLSDPGEVAANLSAIELFEIKTTNRVGMVDDWRGYFFNLSTVELLVAQSLREQFRFAFVNTLTGDHFELSLRQLFARARGIYPSWAIKF